MIEEIKSRRSIRNYLDKDVPKDQIKILLEAAMSAPTAMNKQEWRFVACTNKEILRNLTKMSNYSMFNTANAAIIVCAQKEINDNHYLVDAGAATQNILLEAKSIDLGTCWCAISPYQERIDFVKKLMNINDNLMPVALVAIGYPNEEKCIDDRYDENKVIWL